MKAVITYITTSDDDSATNAPPIVTVTQKIKVLKNAPQANLIPNSPANSNANSI